jgi:protein O-mannosyl-transferase
LIFRFSLNSFISSFLFFLCHFQYQLRSIGILGIAIVTILHLRLSIPGPVTQFSTADNPTAKVNSLLTRFYTFLYLPVFNFKLLVYPHTLSFDWGMDAIPRITSLFDARNIVSMGFYGALCRIAVKCILTLRRTTTPKIISNKRLGRTIQKRKHHQMNSSLKPMDDASITTAATTTVQSNQLWDSENSCSVCKQGLKYRHANVCNFGFTAAALCNGLAQNNKKQVVSLSPLKKYIRNNNNNNNILDAVDNNNNNVCVIDNNCNSSSSSSSPATSITSFYQSTNKHIQHANSEKSSVKSLSNRLIDIVSHVKSAEQSVKQTKLNSASATLISITLLTLPFLPASNLFVYVGFVVAERILYLPSVGYCLLIGLGLGKLINFKVQCKSNGTKSRQQRTSDSLRQQSTTRSIATITLLIILISACSMKTIQRNRDWLDEESLYRSAIKVNPPKGNFSLLL